MRGLLRSSFSKPVRTNRFGSKMQHLSREDLDRMILECSALSAKKGADETGAKGTRSDEKLDPVESFSGDCA